MRGGAPSKPAKAAAARPPEPPPPPPPEPEAAPITATGEDNDPVEPDPFGASAPEPSKPVRRSRR